MRELTSDEILKMIGERINKIDPNKTLKDIINYYGEDFNYKCFIHGLFTPIEQKALNLK